MPGGYGDSAVRYVTFGGEIQLFKQREGVMAARKGSGGGCLRAAENMHQKETRGGRHTVLRMGQIRQFKTPVVGVLVCLAHFLEHTPWVEKGLSPCIPVIGIICRAAAYRSRDWWSNHRVVHHDC